MGKTSLKYFSSGCVWVEVLGRETRFCSRYEAQGHASYMITHLFLFVKRNLQKKQRFFIAFLGNSKLLLNAYAWARARTIYIIKENSIFCKPILQRRVCQWCRWWGDYRSICWWSWRDYNNTVHRRWDRCRSEHLGQRDGSCR